MHQDRFYIPDIPPATQGLWIEGREAHHILHVKRAKTGSKITLFDGKGTEYLAHITEILDGKLKVSVERFQAVDRESHVGITIAFSVPKGKCVHILIQKCAELGVSTLIPVHCKRSVVDVRNTPDVKIDKWKRIVIEASKQCKRNILTKIENVTTFDDLIKTVCGYDLSLIAYTGPDTRSLKNVLSEYPSVRKVFCLIGPEGGFTRDEVEKARNAGIIPVSVGPSVLRIETAAIAVSSMLLYACSD
ncbi:MAG: RsmE family RNA methyltransferase [Candidatus Loosdrechtia sp.]|uniref:RsmE family RNA methyltransferase n=1 Tax=Candidatus Loosdrechtia sp. TaxID=3101272 RepID=UPI003A730913|nr:MAG: RsmE family RNA methyltransferase [Candidatus Jettenia sp. AMX2]